MRSFATYRDILKKKGFRYSFHEAWKKIQRFHFLRDENILSLQWEYKTYTHLKKKYTDVLNRPFQEKTETPNPYPDKIWVAWLQGEENAPALVKKCIASVRQHSAGREVILITEKNISQYVTFPEYIQKKKAKGIIFNTHYSDLLRIFLLAQYGGIWIDSTVYLTAPLPAYILQAPLFCYKSSYLSPGKIKASNWFIAAERNNEIIVRTKELLLEYWKRENYLKHYFIFHFLFAIAIDTIPRLTEQWKAVPYFSNVEPHTLSFELTAPFDEKRWEQIKMLSPVHKLTYKLKPEQTERENTFLQMILNS